MRRRTTKRYTPQRPNYLGLPPLDITAEKGHPLRMPHTFRIPAMATCAPFAQVIIGGMHAGVLDGEDPADPATWSGRTGELTLEAACATIGVCWHHSDFDLETNLDGGWRNYPDVREYGAIVYEELSEVGYTVAHIGAMLTALAEPVVATVLAKAVEEKVNFIEPPQEP